MPPGGTYAPLEKSISRVVNMKRLLPERLVAFFCCACLMADISFAQTGVENRCDREVKSLLPAFPKGEIYRDMLEAGQRGDGTPRV